MNNKEIALQTAAVLSAKKAKDLMVIDVSKDHLLLTI